MLVTIRIACSLLNNWMLTQSSVRIFTNQGLLDISFPWAPICKFSNFSRFILEKISFSWLINQMLLTNIQNYFLTIEIKYGEVTSVAVKKKVFSIRIKIVIHFDPTWQMDQTAVWIYFAVWSFLRHNCKKSKIWYWDAIIDLFCF